LFHLLGFAAVTLHGHSSAIVMAALVNPWTQLLSGLSSAAAWGIDELFGLTHNYGWSMMLLALGVSLLLLPLSLQSLKSMQEMQALAPYIKRLQTKYKNDKTKLGEETMKLYREHGVNPLGGCLPMLAQYPFLIAVYGAISRHNTAFSQAHWLWIGSGISQSFPKILATSLVQPDHLLLLLYAVSMYFSMKLTPTVSMDAQ
jgi:YidC/Oxa1 family membrane protein insertase